MPQDFIAKATATINAPRPEVWRALVTPATIKQYMFGTEVESDWQEGSPVLWKGEWQGRSYEDKGVILQLKPERLLQFSHFSPLAGLPDVPENYHTVTIELSDVGSETRIVLAQDKNPTEEARDHSQKNWELMLAGLKDLLER